MGIFSTNYVKKCAILKGGNIKWWKREGILEVEKEGGIEDIKRKRRKRRFEGLKRRKNVEIRENEEF